MESYGSDDSHYAVVLPRNDRNRWTHNEVESCDEFGGDIATYERSTSQRVPSLEIPVIISFQTKLTFGDKIPVFGIAHGNQKTTFSRSQLSRLKGS
jgi:hypothetical protein